MFLKFAGFQQKAFIKMIKFGKFKVLVPVVGVLIVVAVCFQPCNCDDYSRNSKYNYKSQVNSPTSSSNGYGGYSPSSPAAVPVTHHRIGTEDGGGHPSESRAAIIVPVFIGVLVILFFAVVGAAAVIASATSTIGRRHPFARDSNSVVPLKVQNRILRALELPLDPTQSNLAKRASRAIQRKSKVKSAKIKGPERTLIAV